MTSRIYYVDKPTPRLIDANNQSQAINFAVKSTITARPITAKELQAFLKDGLEIESAIAQTGASETPTAEDTKNAATR